jgi:hypothetical protein
MKVIGHGCINPNKQSMLRGFEGWFLSEGGRYNDALLRLIGAHILIETELNFG